jgi:hypothetical protein
VLSSISLSITSTRLFFLNRHGLYSDANVSPKYFFLVLPFVLMITFGTAFMWILVLFFIGSYSLLCLFCNWILVAISNIIFFNCYKCKCNGSTGDEVSQSEQKKLMLTNIFSSWIFPVSVWSSSCTRNFFQLFVSSISTFVLPIIFLLLFSYTKLANGLFFLFLAIMMYLVPIVFSCCLILQFVGDYHILFKISKIFRLCCCCCQPVVHRSLVVDYLKNKEKFSKG